MKTQEARRGARDDREREAAYQERQARRQAMHKEDAAPVATPPVAKPAVSKPVVAAAAAAKAAAVRAAVARPQATARPQLERPGREGPRGSLILIPFLILISLAAAGAAVYALSNEPSTSNLDGRISALNAELSQARHQLGSLRSQIATSARASNVTQANRSVAGLKKSVGGVQNAIVPLRAELNSMRVCLPQLQAEVSGLAAHAHQKGVTTVGLSPECSTFLGG